MVDVNQNGASVLNTCSGTKNEEDFDDNYNSDDWIESEDDDLSSTDEDESGDDNDIVENAKTPLNAGSPITVSDHVFAVLSLLLRYSPTGTLFASILSLISLHCPKPNFCIPSLYKFKKLFKNIKVPLNRHYYCTVCFTKLEDDKKMCHQCLCMTKVSYFMEIPILFQLEKMYNRPGFRELLKHK